jgi:uncharacterized protein (TIGR02271 family)
MTYRASYTDKPSYGETPNMFSMMFAAQRRYVDFMTECTRAFMPTSAPVRREQSRSELRRSDAFRQEERSDASRQEEVVTIGEEVLNVSTQRVPGEATRVRRVVRNIPVERHVEVHDETIVIERRPANGRMAGVDALADREYIMIDTREIPVVSKSVRVREELVLRKHRTGRVEIVRDTVRHADAEVVQPQRMPMVMATAEHREVGNSEHHEQHTEHHEHHEERTEQHGA